MHVQGGYHFCQFRKEGTDMDIHRELGFDHFIIHQNYGTLQIASTDEVYHWKCSKMKV